MFAFWICIGLPGTSMGRKTSVSELGMVLVALSYGIRRPFSFKRHVNVYDRLNV